MYQLRTVQKCWLQPWNFTTMVEVHQLGTVPYIVPSYLVQSYSKNTIHVLFCSASYYLWNAWEMEDNVKSCEANRLDFRIFVYNLLWMLFLPAAVLMMMKTVSVRWWNGNPLSYYVHTKCVVWTVHSKWERAHRLSTVPWFDEQNRHIQVKNV